MTTKAEKSAYDVRLSEEAEYELTRRLVDEIRLAKTARSSHMEDGSGRLDYAWFLYEQEQSGSTNSPRYGSADLASPIGTENVDALSARAVKTIFTEPLWIAEGVGKSAQKAPIVEEFMQWRQEAVRLQKTAKRAITSALVETGSVLEVCEDAEKVMRVEVVKAEPQRDEIGNLLLGPDGKPMPMLDENGLPVPATDPEVFVEVKRTYDDYRRRGAYVRRRGMKDFVFLPSHAEDDREVWGHATRFWLPLDEIERREKAKEFTNVDKLGGGTHERDTRAEHDRRGVDVQVAHGEAKVEKELWRVQFWADLGKGLSCYIAIVSEIHDAVLQLRCDWLQRWRTIYLNPYPCPYSVYGYSMVLTKLGTTIEEHTAWRNMNADRGTLKANAPMKALNGEDWDPELQPFSAGAVIRVASMTGIQPFEFEDVSVQSMNKENQCVTDAQRIIGLNDIAIGQVSTKARTLGENEMATRESFTRTDDPIGNLQEAFEELGEVMHAIEVQALKGMEQGIEAPAAITEQIQLKYGDTGFDGTFTAEMVDGIYRFKPRGSVEGADPNRRQQVMVNGIGVLANWAQVNPMLKQRMASPEFAEALMQMWVTEFKPRDKQAFLAPMPPPMPPQGMLPPGQPPMGPEAMPAAPNFGGQGLVESMLGGMGVQ